MISASSEIEIDWSPQRFKKGEQVNLIITLIIPQGLHIQAHKPAEELLIPTKIKLKETEGITLGEPVYPEPIQLPTAWSKVVLLVYEGTIEILVPIQVSKGIVSGKHKIEGALSFQGCTESLCLPPQEQEFTLTLAIF